MSHFFLCFLLLINQESSANEQTAQSIATYSRTTTSGSEESRKSVAIKPQEPVVFSGSLRLKLDLFSEYSVLVSDATTSDMDNQTYHLLKHSLISIILYIFTNIDVLCEIFTSTTISIITISPVTMTLFSH
eukprot:UN01172